jgi:SAM-dependent methyltransferase
MLELLHRIFHFNQANRDMFVREWVSRLPRGSKVLDAGAGSCRYAQLFRQCKYIAVDCAIGGSSGRIIDIVSDVAHLPFSDKYFDACVCTEVLEHVPKPIDVVHEIARVLREGGQLLLTAPLGCGLHQQPHHYYGGFTPYWYRRFLPEAGFRDINISPNGSFFRYYGQESQRFSALLDPRRLSGLLRKVFVAPIWALTLPYFRVLLPLVCHFLDALDRDGQFTVGYHVTATRSDLL